MALLEPYNMPFAAALLLMAMLAVVQVVGLADLFGDSDAAHGGGGELHAGGFADGLLSLIGLGRLPLMVWLPIFLGVLAAIGVSGQALAIELTGKPLDRWLAAVLAGGAALPLTGLLAVPVARILPHDETTAIPTDRLLGRRGIITDGTARDGSPARARVVDLHGQAHHVMAEPHDPAETLPAGCEVLLVRREGETFYATAVAPRQLSLD